MLFKFLTSLCALVIVLALAACGGRTPTTAIPNVATATSANGAANAPSPATASSASAAAPTSTPNSVPDPASAAPAATTPSPAPVPAAPSGTTDGNIEQMTNWQACTAQLPDGHACASGLGNAAYNLTQQMAVPSLDGHSAQFNISGPTAYSNALWWRQLNAAPDATHFVYDFWVNVSDSNAPQALEFDVNQTTGGTKYIFGTECNFRGTGKWDVWNGETGKWVPSGVSCAPFQANSWTHIVWTFERANGQVHYISVAINGAQYGVDMWEPPQANVHVEELNVAVQLDGNFKQQAYSIWINKMALTHY